MKKRVVIISIISTIIAILALTVIVMCSVFRVGKINIKKLGEDPILTTNAEGDSVEVSEQQIISASGIKRRSSSLFLNKQTAKNNVEKAFPYLKVVQISLTGAQTVEISVTARHEMFYYTTNNAGFFILDEELKVLKIVTQLPDNLVPISPQLKYLNSGKWEIDENILSTDANSKPGDFLGDEKYRKIFTNLYISMYKTVLVNEDGSLWLGRTAGSDIDELLQAKTIRYLDRKDFCKVISNIEFEMGYTLNGSYTRLILTTKVDGTDGVRVDIGAPENNLEYKINSCFSLVSYLNNDLTEAGEPNENTTASKGIVRFGFDENGEQIIRYLAEQNDA